MILTAKDACELCVAAFRACGMSEREAGAVADVLVEAELWGRRTHGLCRVVGLAERYRRKRIQPLRVLKEGPACLHLDAGTQFGYVVLRDALDRAMDKARDSGVCVVGVRNSDHCGVAGYYAWRAARREFIAALTCDCFPRAAPFGACSPVFGTNPIAVGIPTFGDPVVLDFSIAEMTNGLLHQLAGRGESMPPGLGFDSEGRPTTSPEACLAGAIRTFGGHKGSGVALAAQLLCTAFVGAAPLPDIATDYGYFLVVLRADWFVSLDEFKRRTQTLLDAVKHARPEPGREDVLLPGERSMATRRQSLRDGIRVDEEVVRSIQQFIAEA